MQKKRARRAPSSVSAGDDCDGPRPGGSFPIVGIGASAGGLAAFSALLNDLPLDTGMGFVLVPHLNPEHDSALPQLLGRATSLPIREVASNLRVEPNRVYVIPPDRNLSITAGRVDPGSTSDSARAASVHRCLPAFADGGSRGTGCQGEPARHVSDAEMGRTTTKRTVGARTGA